MKQPPAYVIERACTDARRSTCGKSRRGAVVFNRFEVDYNVKTLGEAWVDTHSMLMDESIAGSGHNGQPDMLPCMRTDECREQCAKICMHAEQRALFDALVKMRGHGGFQHFDLVHVKVDADGQLVAGDGPSCWQCSRVVLDVGIGGVWLYESRPSLPPEWRYYEAADFHKETRRTCGLPGADL